MNHLENIALTEDQRRNIARLTADINDLEEQGLQCMDALLPRYHITIGTVLCPGTCQDCGKHAPMLMEAKKKKDAETVYLFCFLCWWKSIGTPWGTYAAQPAIGMTVKAA